MSLKRFAIYIACLVLGLLAALSTGYDREFDFMAFQYIQQRDAQDVALLEHMYFIDLPSDDACSFRTQVANLLSEFARREDARPRLLVLDAWFSRDCADTGELAAGIEQLEDARIPVYVAFNFTAGGTYEEARSAHDPSVLDAVDGWGHPEIAFRGDAVFYRVAHSITMRESSLQLLALPLTVALDAGWSSDVPEDEWMIVPLGPSSEFAQQTLMIEDGTLRFSEDQQRTVDLHHAVVVVGDSLRDDKRWQDGAPRIGPELLMWALNERQNMQIPANTPLNAPAPKAMVTVTFVFVVVLLFALLYRYVRATQTYPVFLAAGSVCISMALLALCFFVLSTLHWVLPLGMPAMGIILAGSVCAIEGKRHWHMGTVEGTDQYDLFISYSRSAGPWVIEHLYRPLSELESPDGKRLSIYFDQTDEGWGTAFTGRYMQAIVNSRFFVAVFSEDYYAKNHCRNELELAVTRHVDASLRLLPIALSEDYVPPEYKHLDYVLAESERDLVGAIVSAMQSESQTVESPGSATAN